MDAIPAYTRCTILLAPGWHDDFGMRLPPLLKLRWPDTRTPDLDAWALALLRAAPSELPLVVVAQGFACLAAVRAAQLRPGAIAGALLVAPADPLRYGL